MDAGKSENSFKMVLRTDQHNLRFLITAGGTREYIDPVRFISNASSGRMGYALARAAISTGHSVTLITASTVQQQVDAAEIINVETAAEMFAAVKKRFSRCDCLIMAAAVADYTVAKPAKRKIKKTGRGLTIKLKPTTDILRWAGRHKRKNQFTVGFALEDRAVRAGAEKKMREKSLDMIIVNTPDAIGEEKSAVQIKTPFGKWLKLARASKTITAKKIIFTLEGIFR